MGISTQINEVLGEASTADDEEDDLPLPSAKRQRTRTEHKTSDRRKAKVTPRRSIRLQSAKHPIPRKALSTPSSQRLVAVEIASPTVSVLGSAETTGDEDDFILTSSTSRRRSRKTTKDDFIVPDDQLEYYSSEEDVVRPSKSRSQVRKPNRNNDFVADDDSIEYISSDGEPVTPSKKQKLSRSQASPQKELRRKAELEEDLEDLADSDNVVKETRTRGAPVNKEREKTRKHLEILRRRRAGEKVPEIPETGDRDRQEVVDVNRISRNAPRYSVSSDQSSVGSSQNSELPENPNVDQDDDEDDFIVDDTADHHGIHPEIPLEFTSYASRKPRELFIHVVDWLVKNKISPAFNRHDPLWDLSFKKLDDEVKGQAGSRLISAAWNAPFIRTLLARPGLVVVRLPGDEEDYVRTCDACNRTNHPAQYDLQFCGKAYHRKTLEPIDNSDDDEDNDDDAASLDSNNHALPSSQQHFYLGRYCAANAEMGHKLSHWLFHLNQNLLIYLEEQGVLSGEKIVARDKKNHTKREREAEMIVDNMRDTGVVDDLWRDFKGDLDDARIGMDGFEKKGGRSKARIGSIRVQKQDDDGEIRWEGDMSERRYREAPKLFDESD